MLFCLERCRNLTVKLGFHRDVNQPFFTIPTHDLQRNADNTALGLHRYCILLFFCHHTADGQLCRQQTHLPDIKACHVIAVDHSLHYILSNLSKLFLCGGKSLRACDCLSEILKHLLLRPGKLLLIFLFVASLCALAEDLAEYAVPVIYHGLHRHDVRHGIRNVVLLQYRVNILRYFRALR